MRFTNYPQRMDGRTNRLQSVEPASHLRKVIPTYSTLAQSLEVCSFPAILHVRLKGWEVTLQ